MLLLRRLWPFYLVAALLTVASLALEWVNGRFWLNDFRVYYSAAARLRQGLPVYGEVFGLDTGLYKYAPVFLYPFLPFTFLPYSTAAVLHYLLIGACTMAIFLVQEKHLTRLFGNMPKAAVRNLIGLACIAVLLARELHMGNINMMLLLLVVLGLERLNAGKTALGGLLLGIAWLLKPYLLLMAVPLVLRTHWRTLLYAGAAMLIGLALPGLAQGPRTGYALTTQWFGSMRTHTESMFSPDKLGQILHTWFHTPATQTLDLVLIAVAGTALALFVASNRAKRRNTSFDQSLELWLALALVPLLVVTDQQHFMFSLPLILLIITALFLRSNRPLALFFVLAMLLYGTRSSDLWGTFENQIVGWGVLGLGNILLIWVAVAAWWHMRRGTREVPPIKGTKGV